MSSHSAKKGELDKLPDNADIIRSQVADDMKEKLDSLLHLLVDSTKEACIETLERCYSVLQCCLHRHRYCHDKTQLLQVCELILSSLRLRSVMSTVHSECEANCLTIRIIIDRVQKWPPTNYSFVFVLISLTSLGHMRKIERIWL